MKPHWLTCSAEEYKREYVDRKFTFSCDFCHRPADALNARDRFILCDQCKEDYPLSGGANGGGTAQDTAPPAENGATGILRRSGGVLESGQAASRAEERRVKRLKEGR